MGKHKRIGQFYCPPKVSSRSKDSSKSTGLYFRHPKKAHFAENELWQGPATDKDHPPWAFSYYYLGSVRQTKQKEKVTKF